MAHNSKNMPDRRIPTWLLLILVPIGLLIVGIPGLWVFMSFTAKPLHPDPVSMPSVVHSAPLPMWTSIINQGRQIVRASVAEQNLPGLSVAVGINGEIVWAEGFGFADLETSAPVTPKHRFRIGTASTVLTSAAAGLLLEQGRLKLDDDIRTYVPAFPSKQWPVTLRHLMGHTAGVITDGGDEGPLFGEHCERPVEALKYFADAPLRFQPGTQYRHSSYGWILASAAIESAAGQPFLSYMRDRIFQPLAMLDTIPDTTRVEPDEDFPLVNLMRELIYDPEAKRKTTVDATKKQAKASVTPYFPRFASDPEYGLHLMRPLDYSCYAGASVFLSNPSDLARFAMAIDSGKLLQPATVRALHTPQLLASGQETGYGLGWDFETVTLGRRQTRVTGHDGNSLGGNVSSLMTFPEYGLVVAVTSNLSYADTPAIALKIAGLFVDQGKIPARQ